LRFAEDKNKKINKTFYFLTEKRGQKKRTQLLQLVLEGLLDLADEGRGHAFIVDRILALGDILADERARVNVDDDHLVQWQSIEGCHVVCEHTHHERRRGAAEIKQLGRQDGDEYMLLRKGYFYFLFSKKKGYSGLTCHSNG